MPAFFIGGDCDSRRMAFGSGLGDRVGRCNCPLDEDEQQFQVVGNVTKMMGNHSIKFGVDVRRAYNLRVPSDRHRSGELNFENDLTRGPSGGGLALASFMLGDVTRFTRYVSPTTEARERQWRHFYYAQDVCRPTPKLTLNYGLRLDVINPQTLNEAGNGGFLDLATGLINVAGVGRHRTERQRRELVQLGASPWRDLPAHRENRPPRRVRQELRHRRLRIALRPQRDAEPAGAVGAGADRAGQLRERLQPRAGPAGTPCFPPVPANGQFALPAGVFARALPDKQRPPHVDAFNVMVQHQLTSTLSVEAGYVGNRGGNVFAGDGPATNVNQAILTGFPIVSTDRRRPFFAGNVPNTSGFTGPFGWTQGIDYFCNCATNAYDSLQTRFTKRFSGGYSVQCELYAAARDSGQPGLLLLRLGDESRPGRLGSHAQLHVVAGFGIAVRPRPPLLVRRLTGGERDHRAGGRRTRTRSSTAACHSTVTYRDSGADRDTGGNNRPNLIGDPDGPKTEDQWFNATPIGSPGSAFERPARGTFGTMDRNALRGPGYWRVDASLFKHFRLGGTRLLEARIEAVNFFNNVNLANPDSEVGRSRELRTRTPAGSTGPPSAAPIRCGTSSSG